VADVLNMVTEFLIPYNQIVKILWLAEQLS
jgi:hypothetical protein